MPPALGGPCGGASPWLPGPLATNPGGPGEATPPPAARPSSSSNVRALEGIAGSGAAAGTAFARSEKLNGCSGFVDRWEAASDRVLIRRTLQWPVESNCQLEPQADHVD